MITGRVIFDYLPFLFLTLTFHNHVTLSRHILAIVTRWDSFAMLSIWNENSDCAIVVPEPEAVIASFRSFKKLIGRKRKEINMVLYYDSAMIKQVHKQMLYRAEPYRISKNGGHGLTFQGDHDIHYLKYAPTTENHWICNCSFFAARGICRHTMTVEYLEQNDAGWWAAFRPLPIDVE